jgi:hypothetical protein
VSIEIDDRTQSKLWSQTEDRRLKDPERQLLDAITAGELDEHLVAIADAVKRASAAASDGPFRAGGRRAVRG